MGLGIKEGHPIVQVAVYDAVDGINKAIELSTTQRLFAITRDFIAIALR